MSFSSVDNKKQYATDGIVDTFAFPYPFQQTADLEVKLKDNTTLLVTTLVEGVDYNVTTVGDAGRFESGSVVTTSVLASGSTISILRIVDNNQDEANFNPGGDFDEQTTEDAFDKSIMAAQQIYNLAVILKKSGNVAGPLELPDLADFAGKLLQINAAGTGITAVDSASSSDARVNSLFNGAAADDIFTTFINLANGGLIIDGTGTPEGSVVAPIGSIFLRTDGGADTSIYFKESGASDTGWVARDTFSSLVADTLIANTSISTDTISEKTAATGVTVDSCLIKDGAVNAIIDQTGGSNLKCTVTEIGDWDMDADASKVVVTSIAVSKIRMVQAIIRDDGPSGSSFPIDTGVDATDTTPQGFIISMDDTSGGRTSLQRLTGGKFDSVAFNQTSYNRGWIITWHTP